MNRKNIEKTIKHEMQSSTPNVLHEIDLQTIEMKDEPKKRRFYFSIKPLLVPSVALSALVIVLIAVLFNGTTPNGPTNGDMIYSEREEAYTLSAMSAVSLLSQVDVNGNNLHQNTLQLMTLTFNDTGPSILLDDHLEHLNRNLNMIEPLIGQKDSMQFKLETSQMPDYEYQLVFSTTDLRGQNIDFTMHYNEEQDGENDFIITGIMMIGETTYHLNGEIEITSEGFELELFAVHPDDEDTYVEIYQEVTNDEHTLEYEVTQRGDTIYESEISIEFDGDNITIEIEYETDTLELSFDIERTTRHGQYVYHIEYDIDDGDRDEDGEIIVRVVYDEDDDVYYYRYEIETDDEQVVRFRKRIELGN